MASVNLYLGGGKTGYLTTDHSASSYGRPVLIVDGVAHGPLDPVAAMHGRSAHHVVAGSMTDQEHDNQCVDGLEPDAKTQLADDLRRKFSA